MSAKRIAVIGYGVAGSAFHAPLIAATDGLELAAVVTGDVTRAAQAKERYPGVDVVARADDLWALDIDAVTVATPPATHTALAAEALRHGAAVVVDKPLATTVAEAEDLLAAATAADLPLTAYFNRRWDGDFRTVRQLLDAETLGRVHRFESRFERFRPTVATGWKETVPVAAGGGTLRDLGPHLVDQALTLFGPVTQVYAEVDVCRPGATNPDDAFLALTHANGVHSHLWTSAIAADLGPRFRLLGTQGGYHVDGLDGQEAVLRNGGAPTPGQPWGEVPEAEWGVLTEASGTHPVPTLPGAYPDFYAQWAAALAGAGPVPVAPADAIAGLRILAAAEESSATGAVVRLSDAGD